MRRSGAPVQMGARRGAWDLFGAAWGTVTEIIWSALAGVFKTSPSISTSSPAGACATPLLAEAIVRRAGALVALGAASVLVPLLFPAVEALKHGVLAAYAIVLLGCASVFLSPAHHAIADLARRAAEATGRIFGASWRAAAEPWSAAAVCRTGALVALAAASALLLLLLPDHAVVASKNINGVVLALYAVLLLGCAALLLSPAHRPVAELARWAAEATGEILGSPWRATARPWSETAAAVRRTGALVALAAASKLLLLLMPVPEAVASKNINGVVLALYSVFLLGCAAVLLSAAHPAIANLARRAAEAARKNLHATGRANAVLRWAGFTCICTVFCTICAVGSVGAEAAAAVTVVSTPEQFGSLVLFLLFLVGVCAVSLSMVTGRGPPTLPVRLPLPPAEHDCGGGAANCTAPAVQGSECLDLP